MRYIIEVKDERDKNSPEPWSHFSANYTEAEFKKDLLALAHYIECCPIEEIRIKIEK